MNKLKIAGVVVLYQPTDQDISNIDTYIDDLDILYVMDNSTKKNNHRLPDNKKIEYIFNNDNLGLAIPLNSSAQLSRENGYDWLLTMDQDTRFTKGVIKKLKEYASTVNYQEIAIITPWHNTKLKTEKPTEKIDYPLDVMTSGNLLNLQIHKKLGGFKEWIFIDGVDIEYCLNVKKNNYKVMRINEIEMQHNLGDIFYKKFLWKDLLVTNHSPIRRYYQMRNYHYIKDMYLDSNKKFCKILVRFKTIILAVMLYENKKKEKIKYFIRGYKDYKKNKRGKYNE